MKAILVGRFQPFTMGHLYAVNYLKGICDEVAIGVSTPFYERIDADNPFPILWRTHWASVATSLKTYVVCGYNPKFLPEGYSVAVGRDRIRSMMVLSETQKGWNYVIVPRNANSISASSVRKALRANDRGRFNTLVPDVLHDQYDEMRKMICAVPE